MKANPLFYSDLTRIEELFSIGTLVEVLAYALLGLFLVRLLIYPVRIAKRSNFVSELFFSRYRRLVHFLTGFWFFSQAIHIVAEVSQLFALLIVAGFFAAFVFCSIDPMKNLMAGLIFFWQTRVQPGNRVSFGEQSGVIERFGLMRTQVKFDNGTVTELGNHALLSGMESHGAESSGYPVEVRLSVEEELQSQHCESFARLNELAIEIANNSPFRMVGSPVKVLSPDKEGHFLEIHFYSWSPEGAHAARIHFFKTLHREPVKIPGNTQKVLTT